VPRLLTVVLAGVLALICACCSPAASRSPEPARRSSQPLEFAFGVLDGTVLTDEATRGRVTALLFVTTFDLPSQAAARRLAEVQARHVPRFNAAAVALESAENATLVGVFRDTLALPYPVAIADRIELQSSSAFGAVDRVPTLVVLDRAGRAVRSYVGVFETPELVEWLREAEK
jgi:thiol-disulfide isomerase/thioredoxin